MKTEFDRLQSEFAWSHHIYYFSKKCWQFWDRAQNMLFFWLGVQFPLRTILAVIMARGACNFSKSGCLLWVNCDPLSQNEHKVATAAFQTYYRFKFFIMQALKWCMICGYSSLICPAKFNMLCWFSFVFYCFVACLTAISLYTNWRLNAHFVVAGHNYG